MIKTAAAKKAANKGKSTQMTLRLSPLGKESRIMIEWIAPGSEDAAGSWSLLVPETVSTRESITTHCHVIPPKWKQVESGWEVELELDSPKCIYRSQIVKIDDEVIEIRFSIKNIGKTPMTDTEADFCFCCVSQPEFSSKDWYNRSFVRVSEQVDAKGRCEVKHEFIPVGAMRSYFSVALNPIYAIFGKNIADVPLVICRSLDGKKIYAGGFERSTRIGTSVGTCIHSWPWLGTILPGEEVTCGGRFYYMVGTLEDVVERFRSDFVRE